MTTGDIDTTQSDAAGCDSQCNAMFARYGLRCTKQRKAIYSALTASRCHPTADELYNRVGGSIEGLSLATVYNTLDAFCSAGLIAKLPGAGGTNGSSARFDAHTTPHMHLRDSITGSVADAPDDLSAQLLKHIPKKILDDLTQRTGFAVDQIQIELVGRFEEKA